MRKARIALIGSGVIGKRHLLAMKSIDEVELVAIADPFPPAEALATEESVPYFSDNEKMLAQCKPDGVIVATPTEHHLDPTLASLEAGAHVLVEKPIMATVAEAEKAIQRSEQSGCHVLVGHQRRYYPQVHQAREIINSGKIGKLVAVSGQWCMRKHDEYYEPEWRKAWKAGPVLTNLIHEIDSLRYICGDLESIMAETTNVVQGYEKEDAAALLMRFTSGVLGSFVISDQAHSPWSWERATGENAAFPQTSQNAIRFMGTEGALDFPNLTRWHSGELKPEWRNEVSASEIKNTLEDAYIMQLEHFARVISGEEPPRVGARDATETLRATVAVYQAAREGVRIDLTH